MTMTPPRCSSTVMVVSFCRIISASAGAPRPAPPPPPPPPPAAVGRVAPGIAAAAAHQGRGLRIELPAPAEIRPLLCRSRQTRFPANRVYHIRDCLPDRGGRAEADLAAPHR